MEVRLRSHVSRPVVSLVNAVRKCLSLFLQHKALFCEQATGFVHIKWLCMSSFETQTRFLDQVHCFTLGKLMWSHLFVNCSLQDVEFVIE